MALVCAQRDAIEGLLTGSEGLLDSPPSIQLKSSVHMEDGRKLHLLGISEGANIRGVRWQSIHIAVYGDTRPEGRLRLPNGMKADDDCLVHAAVMLSDPEDQIASNEHQVVLLADSDSGFRPNGAPRRYCSTIC